MPDFIVIGTQKGGSTSMYQYLASHPYVVPSWRKEVDFFDLYYSKGVSWYRSFFPSTLYYRFFKEFHKRGFLTGEASPYYLIHPHAPKRVSELLPQVKLIAVLRNPVDRAYSHYAGEFEPGYETIDSFEEAIDREEERLEGEYEKLVEDGNYYSYNHHHYSYLTRGIYADQLTRWFEYFPREQILILSSEDLRTDTSGVFKAVQDFLGLPHWEPPAFKKHLSRKYTKKLDAETRKRLVKYFIPHNKRLYNLLGKKFDWDK
ncbi:MAG: sulfotransferase domain-containing protein [Planctomycetota bacterium]|nr:MAG: sulfotransferase domain-containing protein [Planctomycetota bacterium]